MVDKTQLPVIMWIGMSVMLKKAAIAAVMTSVVFEEAPVMLESVTTRAVMSLLIQASKLLPQEWMMALEVSAVGRVSARCGSVLSIGMRLPSVYHVSGSW